MDLVDGCLSLVDPLAVRPIEIAVIIAVKRFPIAAIDKKMMLILTFDTDVAGRNAIAISKCRLLLQVGIERINADK